MRSSFAAASRVAPELTSSVAAELFWSTRRNEAPPRRARGTAERRTIASHRRHSNLVLGRRSDGACSCTGGTGARPSSAHLSNRCVAARLPRRRLRCDRARRFNRQAELPPRACELHPTGRRRAGRSVRRDRAFAGRRCDHLRDGVRAARRARGVHLATRRPARVPEDLRSRPRCQRRCPRSSPIAGRATARRVDGRHASLPYRGADEHARSSSFTTATTRRSPSRSVARSPSRGRTQSSSPRRAWAISAFYETRQ